MFNQVGWGEILVLLLIGLFVFGPERLPKVARDAGRMLRELRRMANNAQADIRTQLGPEFADLDVRSLHPRAFVQKHLFDDEDDDLLLPPSLTKRAPLGRETFDLPDVRSFLSDDIPSRDLPAKNVPADGALSLDKQSSPRPSVPRQNSGPAPFDLDAT
jgi:sec-independent protein translocase protein TatB